MKHKIIIVLILTIFLSGCNFTTPDTGFVKLIIELDKPHKIGFYMWSNFTYKYQPYRVKTPYQLYLCKKGDCNDFSNFATYVAYCNGYEVWQIRILFRDHPVNHWLGIYKEGKNYTFTSNQSYFINKYKSFLNIVDTYCRANGKNWREYEVYDHNLNFIQGVVN